MARIKEDIDKLHRKIYSTMKKKALSYEGEHGEDLQQYQKDQRHFASRPFKLSTIEGLLKAISKSNVVYLGDFHTFDQSGRNLKRLLETLMKKETQLVLGVEFIHQRHQLILDKFLENKIDELEFLEAVNYKDSWRFPWEHYKPFFDMARDEKIKILALNSEGSLLERDKYASEFISKYLLMHPQTTLLILFGELHIIPNKLPDLVSNKLIQENRKINQTIIHQNLDQVYWKMRSQGKSNGIIKFNNFEFSLQSSPPWIKYESMIYWYENLLDDPEFDIHEFQIEKSNRNFSESIDENFLFICNEILAPLNICINKHYLEDFSLYDHSGLNFMLNKINKIRNSKFRLFYKELLTEGRLFKLPLKNYYYCPSYSINRLSYLAGIHIYSILHSENSMVSESIFDKSSQTEKFLFLFYQSLMGYLSSKIINPNRKCDLYPDFKAKLKSKTIEPSEKEYLKLVIQILDKKTKLKEIIKNKRIMTIYNVSRYLGHMIADQMYDNIFKRSPDNFEALLYYVINNNFSTKEFSKFIGGILPGNYKKVEKRLF